jgi:hypothetical protein
MRLGVSQSQSGKDKGKVRPITEHEGPEVEYRYRYILSLTSALDGGGWSTPRPGRFTPGDRAGTHCTGGCVGPRDGLSQSGRVEKKISCLCQSRTSILRSPVP